MMAVGSRTRRTRCRPHRLVGAFRAALPEIVETVAATGLRTVQATGKLGDADLAALLAGLRKLAASYDSPDV